MVQNSSRETISNLSALIKGAWLSIGTKIVLPYFLLTLVVAAAGAYIVTNLVTSTLQERIDNQLVSAGKVVSENLVDNERNRLELLRVIAFTEGVAEALADGDFDALAGIVPQIAANSDADTVILADGSGREVLGWTRASMLQDEVISSGNDFSLLEDVMLVLDGFEDDLGSKRAFLGETASGYALFTVGSVALDGEIVGAALVGHSLRDLVIDLSESAIARVTLYDDQGRVIETTLGLNQSSATGQLDESPELYPAVIEALKESPEQVSVITAGADNRVQVRQMEVLSQDYQLAYGDWRLRDQSFGLFSVALPSNFIVSAANLSRNNLSLLFSAATILVFTMGYFIARRITLPLNQLVRTSQAIAQGQLEERTGIQRGDEIGTLAASFDLMTSHLAQRNRQLEEQASELEAILHSIVDAVIVLDDSNRIIAFNPAAQLILPHTLGQDALASNGNPASGDVKVDELKLDDLLAIDSSLGAQRFEIGSRVFGALDAPVKAPDGQQVGRVIVLRDITREAEVELLKDGFITSVSHELRTPLTSIKGFIDLLIVSGADRLGEQGLQFARVINDNTDKMMEHVNKLIDIAEIQSGTLQLRRQREPFARMVAETTAFWESRMKEKGLELTLNVQDQDLWVHTDTVRFVWAVDNLMRNAHDYTLKGSVTVTVYREGDEACVEVTDTGVGISTADQPFLFSRFFRAHNRETFNVPGIGLDLYIARSIIELHGGRVWVQSELGQGSTFGIALKLARQPEQSRAAS